MSESRRLSGRFTLARAAAKKQRALKKATKYCYITQRKVTICIDFPDYSLRHPGTYTDIYCEYISECYRERRHCRYSGITPLYPDPFDKANTPAQEPPDDETSAE